MVNSNIIDLKLYEEINRRDAMLSIGAGEKIICRFIRKDKKSDFSEIYTIEDLSNAIDKVQKRFYEEVEFYKMKKN